MSATAPKTNGRTPRVLAASSEPMTHGMTHGLADALLAFHAEAPKLRRDQPGQIGSRAYTYTSLDSLLDDVEPLLLNHDLLWSAKVTLADGQPAALYRMEHVPSGESEEWTGPLPCVDPGPQALGSAITYMRRYTLQAYLNLAPGEDDDGAAASSQTSAARAPTDQPTGPSSAPRAAEPKPSERHASAKQRTMIEARARAASIPAGDLANIVIEAASGEPREWQSDEHAEQTLGRLLDRLPARLVDAVLEGIGARS